MKPSDLIWGMNGDVTVTRGSQVFDLWRTRPGGPIQVSEFPVTDAFGKDQTLTTYINSPERLEEFLADKVLDASCSTVQQAA